MKMGLKQVAEIKLTYLPEIKPSEREKITSSQDAYRVFLESWDKTSIYLVEHFKVMFLTRNNKVLGVYTVSTGGTTGTLVDPKLVFSAALLAPSSQIILAHNHPSGNMQPSEADLKTTKSLKEAGELLNIKVLDHLIISPEEYTSLSDDGYL